jgi:hypothetical protein
MTKNQWEVKKVSGIYWVVSGKWVYTYETSKTKAEECRDILNGKGIRTGRN